MSQPQPKLWFPNLDALRAIAFLSVFISHAALFGSFKSSNPILIQGDLGVNFFFVLSGFLITFLLFKEKEESEKIKVRKFYEKRVRRIWPVYFITLLVGSIIEFSPDNLKYFLLFAGNFPMAYSFYVPLSIAVLWSVSVEEQFYIVWPWLMRFKLKIILGVIFTGIIVANIYRFINIGDPNIVAYSSLSVMSDLLVGCLLGLSVYNSKKFKEIISNLPRFASVSIWLTTFAFLISNISWPLAPLTFSILSALIIVDQVFGKYSWFKLDQFSFLGINKSLNWLGKHSYGLYCYHIICIIFVPNPFLAFPLVCIAAALSYKYIEKPILK